MKNLSPTPYAPLELEIIMLVGNDIVTASAGGGNGNDNGYKSDENEENDW